MIQVKAIPCTERILFAELVRLKAITLAKERGVCTYILRKGRRSIINRTKYFHLLEAALKRTVLPRYLVRVRQNANKFV